MAESTPRSVWGVVTGVSPLEVRLDGDDEPLSGQPSSLVAGLVAGQRVRCEIQNRRVTVVGSAAGGIPAGVVELFAGGTAPGGFLLCNGQAVSRASYLALYAVIGDTYGAGDGSTTFNVPDMRGRVAAGFDATQTEFNTLGKKYGTKTHTLTKAEMPAHDHDGSGSGTSKLVMNGTGGSGGANITTGGGGYILGSTDSSGGGGAHNNIQPSIALNYIIKF